MSFWDEFVAPVPLGAVGLLIVNDHVLKLWTPSALTGKLSDLAICFFLPLFIAALLAISGVGLRVRFAIGALITAAAFAAQESSDAFIACLTTTLAPVAQLLRMRHGLVFTKDPSDLWTMLAIPAAALYARRRSLRLREDTNA